MGVLHLPIGPTELTCAGTESGAVARQAAGSPSRRKVEVLT